MNSDLDIHIKILLNLVNAPNLHRLTKDEINSIYAGIAGLKTIQDGNYQLETVDQETTYITKDEITATLRAIANIIEKGVT